MKLRSESSLFCFLRIALQMAVIMAVAVAAVWVSSGPASAQTSPDIRIVADDYAPTNGSDVKVSFVLLDADLNPTSADEDTPISFTVHGEINKDYLPSRFEFEVDGAAPPPIPGGEYSVVIPAGATSVEFTINVAVSDIEENENIEAIIGAWHDPDPSEFGGLTPLGQAALTITDDDTSDEPTTQDPPPDPPGIPYDTTPTDPDPPGIPYDTTPTNPGGHNDSEDRRDHYTGAREGGIQRILPDVWVERLLPERRFVPADVEAGRWLRSSPVKLTRWDGGDAPFPESSVRIAARRHADGRVEFGLQQRRGDGTWNGRALPAQRIVPVDTEADRWLAGSPQTVQIAAVDVKVRITARRLADGRTEFALQQSLVPSWFQGRDEVRITARRLADGRTQFGLQQRLSESGWSRRVLPGRRIVSADAEVGRWLAGSPVALRLTATEETAPADIVVRIATRSLADGRAEFALQQRLIDETWSEPLLPTWQFFPSDGGDDWLAGPPVPVDADQSIQDTDQPAQTA